MAITSGRRSSDIHWINGKDIVTNKRRSGAIDSRTRSSLHKPFNGWSRTLRTAVDSMWSDFGCSTWADAQFREREVVINVNLFLGSLSKFCLCFPRSVSRNPLCTDTWERSRPTGSEATRSRWNGCWHDTWLEILDDGTGKRLTEEWRVCSWGFF